MVLFNYSTKELTAKVVYYGPGLCGKTTNLQWIHEKLPIKNKGKMLSLATETDRTLFFDFLPIELGSIRGMKTRIQLYTVPGQVFYNATRRMVLKGADCVVFVCDSQEPMLEANLESWQNLRENLQANEIDPAEIPLILQYNKRDLPNALPLEILNERLNPRGLPFFEAMAIKGQGVEETLKGATALVFKTLASKYGGAQSASVSAATPPRAEAPAPPPAERTKTDPAPVRTDPLPGRSEPSAGKGAPAAAKSAPSQRPGAAARAAEPPPTTRPDRVVAMDAEEEDIVVDMEDLPPAAASYESELSLDDDAPEVELEALEPAPAAVAAPAARRTNPSDTLVKGPEESEDMRRKLRRPPEPELTLEGSDDEVELEEIPLEDSPVPEPVARPAAPQSPAPVRAVARASTALAPPPAPHKSAAAPVAVTTVPVSVELGRASGPADIAIPVDVFLGDGDAQVHINLRLTLNLKLRK